MGVPVNEEKHGMVKKIIAIVGILGALCFTVLAVNYVSNEHFIDRYENRVYENSRITPVLGFTQPYIYHYNQGNIYYKNGDYDGAEYEYRRALENGAPEDYDCKIRINLALSMVTPIDADGVTEENLDETIELLESAKDILIENGCAHRDDNDGHSEDAQTLKNEIDEFEEELKKQVEEQKNNDDRQQQDDKDKQKDEQEKDENQNEADAKNDEIRDKLYQSQQDSMQQRQQEMDEYDYDGSAYGSSASKPW